MLIKDYIRATNIRDCLRKTAVLEPEARKKSKFLKSWY
jgi:hypothetical protein